MSLMHCRVPRTRLTSAAQHSPGMRDAAWRREVSGNDRKRETAAPWQASPSSYHPLHHRQWTRGMASDCFGIVFRKVKAFWPFSNDVAVGLS